MYSQKVNFTSLGWNLRYYLDIIPSFIAKTLRLCETQSSINSWANSQLRNTSIVLYFSMIMCTKQSFFVVQKKVITCKTYFLNREIFWSLSEIDNKNSISQVLLIHIHLTIGCTNCRFIVKISSLFKYSSTRKGPQSIIPA